MKTPIIFALAGLLVACSDAPDKRFQKVDNATNNMTSNNVSSNNSNLCGNGQIDPGESCDPMASGAERCPTECPDAELSCATIELVGTGCQARCEVRPVACVNDDGCCTLGCNSANDNDCTNICGDDVTDPNETCDGNCPTSCDDNNACTTDSFTGSAENCSFVCVNTPRTACANNDGCCPAGCDAENDNDCSDTCGNGVRDINETCDGDCPTSCNDNNACTQDVLTGSAATCSAACSNSLITSCQSGDGCCPAGCNSQNDNDCVCTPITSCQALNAECGTINDGCQPRNCGTCSGGEVCQGNQCVTQTVTTAIGTACSSDGQCGSGQSCLLQSVTGITGGYCTRGCSSDAACGVGAHCGYINSENNQGICLRSCSNATQCGRTSYECFDTDRAGRTECWPTGTGTAAIGATCSTVSQCSGGQGANCLMPGQGFNQGYCSTFCNSSTNCGTGNHCSLFGLCVKNSCNRTGYLTFDADDDGVNECWPAATGSTPVGGACNNTWECTGGQYGHCQKEDANGFLNGYCMIFCGIGEGICPSGTECIDLGSASVCLDKCANANECRTGYQCTEPEFGLGNVCWL